MLSLVILIVFSIACFILINVFPQIMKLGQLNQTKKLKIKPELSELVNSYEKQGFLLTQHENVFFQALKEAAPEKYHISTKVRWADIFQVKKGYPSNKRHGLFSRIKSKHVDFVLIDSKTGKIECLIELDDSTHSSKKVQERDSFQMALCQATKTPILRQLLCKKYDIAVLRRDLLQAMDKCHECGEELVERVKKHDSGKEFKFRGCSSFPKCSFTMNLNNRTKVEKV